MMLNHESLVRDVIDARLSNRYLYVYEKQGWLMWDSARWSPVPREQVRKVIGDWAHSNFKAATAEEDRKFWAGVCNYDNQEDLTALAEGHLLHFVREFDNNPLMLNCANVTVDLVTGETHEHDPKDMFTRVTAVDYVPGATHPDWTKALSALPEELHDWYQLRMGQAITGEMTPDGKIIFQIGHGENGKSAIMDTIRFALGTRSDRGYALMANRSTLASGPTASGINSALASFEGMRLAVVEELADGHFLNTTALKELADTATISARQPYQQEQEFLASHSLFVNSNYQPSIADTDDGTWRRLLLVNFPYKFSDTGQLTEWHREPDLTLKARLRDGVEQREAALAWLVAGSIDYHTAEGHKRFLDITKAVQVQTKAWRTETDLIMLYVEKFLVFDPKAAVRTDDLREHYNTWAESLGHKPLSASKFNARFAGHTLVTSNNVERNKPMRTSTLEKVISYPPNATPLGTKSQVHKVWQGFRYRTDDDDALDVGPSNPNALGNRKWA